VTDDGKLVPVFKNFVAFAGAAAELADFCGKRVERVRRVALDRDYERLQTPHAVQYACPTCSEAKEQQRSTGGTP